MKHVCRMIAPTPALLAATATLLAAAPAAASLSAGLSPLLTGSGDGSSGRGSSTCRGIGCNSNGSSQSSSTVPGSGTPAAGVSPDADGDEGNEGDEGRFATSLFDFTAPSTSSSGCSAQSNAKGMSDFQSAHASAISSVFAEFCQPGFGGSVVIAAGAAHVAGEAIAASLAATQAQCVSSGDAFACANASATAEAWADATVTGHAEAVAIAIEDCECLAGAGGLSVGSASLYLSLMAETFAAAEVMACSEGDSSAFASAYASCSAATYATVWTEVRPGLLRCAVVLRWLPGPSPCCRCSCGDSLAVVTQPRRPTPPN